MLRAVAQEEEQQEQHEEEADQRAERADSTTPPPIDATLRSAASVARPSHSWMSAADTASSSRAMRASGPITGYCSRRMRMLPSSLKFAAANEVHQRARLVHELECQQGERREQREGREARDDACRHARLAAQLARQPAVQRVEQEGEEDRPGHRAREGLEDQQHAVPHQHGERDEEGFCVELHVHP